MVRIHSFLVDRAQAALLEIMRGDRPADRVIESLLKSDRKWGARDRKFLAETIYDCVRWYRRLHDLARSLKLPEDQIVWIYGALHDWEDVPEEFDVEKIHELFEAQQKKSRAIRESYPDWIDQLGESQLGDKWEREMAGLNHTAPVDLRVNRLKSSVDQVLMALKNESVDAVKVDGFVDTVSLTQRKSIFSTEAFRSGLFEVQDRSSQTVAPFLKVEPGHRVIDACAGAGGKSLHLAALMGNKGKIIAMDVYERKLEELRIRSRRAGSDIIETRWIESSKVIKRLESSCDRLLLDVPCTGLGVVRRNPDTKWKLTEQKYKELLLLQEDLLNRYSKMLKPGGLMVYATCSLLPSENDEQIEKFIQSQAGAFVLEDTFKAWPRQQNGDGFFAARLKRV